MIPSIIPWYRENKRDLPFRTTKDPYKVWLSEIILQQTKVEQGLAYYERFVAEFPTINHLSAATEDKVLQMWEGLGYYSRARNLLYAAKTVVKEYDGKFPDTYEKLLKLKGVGEYTAAAISSICFGESISVVDGNVNRVISRLFAEPTPIDTGKGKKTFKVLANQILDKKKPGEHNQAVMELGALVCTPIRPDCNSCPLSSVCLSLAKSEQHLYPIKEKKIKRSSRYLYLYIIEDKTSVIIQKREKKDIWQGLYQFPLVESKTVLSDEDVLTNNIVVKQLIKTDFHIEKISEPIKHVLSHQDIYARFVHVYTKSLSSFQVEGGMIIDWKSITNYAMPRLITRYMEK